jgi:hypothetical protein
VIASRDSRATGKDPVPLNNWPLPMPIESKSNTATPLNTTPEMFVPPGPVNVGVPLVLIVYVPAVVGNIPSDAKSIGLSGPPRAVGTPAATAKPRNATAAILDLIIAHLP